MPAQGYTMQCEECMLQICKCAPVLDAGECHTAVLIVPMPMQGLYDTQEGVLHEAWTGA